MNKKVISSLIILYAFLLPLSRAGISALTAILFIFWLLDSNLKERTSSILQNRVIIAILIFFGFSTLSLLWSDNVSNGLYLLKNYWYFLTIFVLATHVRSENISKIISAFLFGMLISEILSYGMFFELWSLKNGSSINPTPFMNHLQYSMFLTFTSMLLLNRFFFETKLKWKIFYFIYFLTVTSNLFINAGRTGQLAFAVSIFVVIFLNIKKKFIGFISLLVFVTSIFYIAYSISPVFKDRFDQGKVEVVNILNDSENKYTGSFGLRLGAWILGAELVKEKPMIGTGIGSEMEALAEKVNASSEEFKSVMTITKWHFHNSYVTYAVQLGLVGLLLYLNIMYQVIKLDIDDKELSNLKYIFITVFAVSSVVEEMFSAQFSLALFALFIGIFISRNNKIILT